MASRPTGHGAGGFDPPPAHVVYYLRDLSGVLTDVIDARRGWIEQLGPLILEAYRRDPRVVARSAAELGREQLDLFRRSRGLLGQLRPPGECVACHAAAASWLDEHVTACERLILAGETRDLRRLQQAQEPLAEARVAARRINEEYARLVAEVRRRVPRQSRRTSRFGLPFGSQRRRPRSSPN